MQGAIAEARSPTATANLTAIVGVRKLTANLQKNSTAITGLVSEKKIIRNALGKYRTIRVRD